MFCRELDVFETELSRNVHFLLARTLGQIVLHGKSPEVPGHASTSQIGFQSAILH